MRGKQWALALGCAVATLPALGFAAGKCERLVATGSPDAPPYLWRDPQDPRHLMGASADVLAKAAAELGLKIEVLYAGRRSQALEEVRSGRIDLLADAPLAAAELETLDYVHPALALNDYLVWTRHDSSLPYHSLADLHGHRGGVSAKARLTPAFRDFAEEHLTLEESESLTPAFQRLTLGQVEYVIAPRYAGSATAQALGLGDDLQARDAPVDRPGLYLALGHDSACNDGWLRGQLAKKMTELAASGDVQALLQRNVEIWRAQQRMPAGSANPGSSAELPSSANPRSSAKR